MELFLILFQSLGKQFLFFLDSLFFNIVEMTWTATIIISIVLLARLLLCNISSTFSHILWIVVFFRLLWPFTELVAFGSPTFIMFHWMDILLLVGKYIWVIGFLVLFLYHIQANRQLRKQLIGSIHMEDNIFLADHIYAPFTMGLLFPKIYLPSRKLSDQEQLCVIAHEQRHIQRHDHILKFFAYLVLCLYWFHPLVWIAFFAMSNDIEQSCDELVISNLEKEIPEIRTIYATLLLRFTTGTTHHVLSSLSFNTQNLKKRVKHVMNYKNRSIWLIIPVMICVFLLSIILLALPQSQTSQTVLHGIYSTEDLIYNTSDSYVSPYETKCQFWITDDYKLYQKKANETTWNAVGQLEAYDLSNRELQSYMLYQNGWKRSYHVSQITDAYILRIQENMFYYVIQTNKGDTLLSYGWEDIGERYDSASDDTNIRFLLKLTYESKMEEDHESN